MGADGIVSRFGPDPASRYYKLDEQLLWDEALDPLCKLVLIDFFHRDRNRRPVPSIGERARAFRVSYDTLSRTEEKLQRAGYLLRRQRAGKRCRYVAAYPPVPSTDTRRGDFERALDEACETDDLPQNAATQVPQNAVTTSRKMLEDLPQNAVTQASHSLLGTPKEEEGGEAHPPACESLPGDLHLQALRVFNENRDRADVLLGYSAAKPLIDFFEEILARYPGTTFPAAIWDFAEQDAREFTKRPTGTVPLTCLIAGFRKGLDARATATAKPAVPPVSLTPAQIEYLRREDEERREWIAREREKARAAEEATAEERKRRAAECVAAARRRYGQPRQPAGVSR